ncbi:IS200/IS605 family transposase [candidate division KSB1 bacterium]|nr:IS200/IS605 family transposase [candidate division KSB1 bacterium]NIR71751.1 IS200/IS605 family transposase [candidate division KSB1 bacterium]NIS23481.1 IS200/IS605 family transposase [candidate division KSB1 bacterium]NIT70404.1 IS200/IS605 family transposase [candidate division KSB1 bacterium]NIU24104.1 IS200/IS605 family transposase [candidate division KSB1 bacterium]
MALWRLYYHVVWATRERLPLITAAIESHLYGYIIGKAQALECITHAVGGIEDHIHVVVSVPPKLSVAEFVQQVKGSSAYHINHSDVDCSCKFAWQRGYGVFSLGSKQLERAVHYVRNQKRHHRERSTISHLENMAEEDDDPAPWNHGEALAWIPVKDV